MITYTYDIASLECKPELNGVENIVETVHWLVQAVDGNYSESAYGAIKLTIDEAASFKPYEDLTKPEIIAWAKTAIGQDGIAQIEASLADEIEKKINPPIVKPPLPWGNNA
jgi:hypothetical protein